MCASYCLSASTLPRKNDSGLDTTLASRMPAGIPMVASRYHRKTHPQKETERHHIRSFRCLCSDFPAGELTECETPDFLVVTAKGRTIGIEITRVFKTDGTDETAEQADEATKEAITVAARMHAECLTVPPAHVSLFFNPQYLRRIKKSKKNVVQPEPRFLTKKEKQNIARSIAQFVHKNMPPQGCSIRLEPSCHPDQPREVDLILINRVHPVDRHRWCWLEVRTVQHDAIERLQKAICIKSQRRDACRRNCEECWLLVVAPSFQSSGTIHPDEKSLSHIYTSPFSRTYFLDFGYGSVVRLNTTV